MKKVKWEDLADMKWPKAESKSDDIDPLVDVDADATYDADTDDGDDIWRGYVDDVPKGE